MRSNCEVYCGFNFISGSGSEGLAIFEFFFLNSLYLNVFYYYYYGFYFNSL